jgi:hypothetical protein
MATKFIRKDGKLINARVDQKDKLARDAIKKMLDSSEGRERLAQAMVGPIRKSLALRMGF